MRLEDITARLGDFTRDAIVICAAEPVDAPGPRVVWANRAAADMTGYAADEILGLNPRVLQGPETCPDTRRRIRAKLAAWQPVRETLLNYRKDGTAFWVELDINPIADASGWYHYWVSVQRDVTEAVERNRAFEETRDRLIRATELLRVGFEASGDGIWEWDLVADRISLNPAASLQLGFKQLPFEPSLAEMEQGIHPDDWPAVRDSLKAVATGTHDVHDLEFRILHASGEYRWLLSRGKVVARTPDGKPTRIVGTHKDVHARRTLEHRLSVALVRTQAADLAKAQFLRLMNHEIRTPLNGILGLADLLESRSPDGEAKDYARHIREAGERLAELMINALTLVSASAEELPSLNLRFDIRQIAAAATQLSFRIATEKGIATALTVTSDVARSFEVISDPARVERILAVLADNAAKFTAQGRIDVALSLAGEECRIEVRDTGVGIAEDKVHTIFQPFNQSGEGLARPHEGAGLGLAACHALVRSMGGDIELQTAPGKGTAITVRLPVRRATPLALESVAQASGLPAGALRSA